MFNDLTFGTNDIARAERFYSAVFAVLGHQRLPDNDGWIGWGQEEGFSLWLCPPFNKASATAGNGTMLTFKAKDAAQVRAFHEAGLANGGTDEGAPGVRAYYDPQFYVAYLRDPDGNKLACMIIDYDGND